MPLLREMRIERHALTLLFERFMRSKYYKIGSNWTSTVANMPEATTLLSHTSLPITARGTTVVLYCCQHTGWLQTAWCHCQSRLILSCNSGHHTHTHTPPHTTPHTHTARCAKATAHTLHIRVPAKLTGYGATVQQTRSSWTSIFGISTFPYRQF
jgi:hypothetical protein